MTATAQRRDGWARRSTLVPLALLLTAAAACTQQPPLGPTPSLPAYSRPPAPSGPPFPVVCKTWPARLADAFGQPIISDYGPAIGNGAGIKSLVCIFAGRYRDLPVDGKIFVDLYRVGLREGALPGTPEQALRAAAIRGAGGPCGAIDLKPITIPGANWAEECAHQLPDMVRARVVATRHPRRYRSTSWCPTADPHTAGHGNSPTTWPPTSPAARWTA